MIMSLLRQSGQRGVHVLRSDGEGLADDLYVPSLPNIAVRG
jgi:hypothetical protein